MPSGVRRHRRTLFALVAGVLTTVVISWLAMFLPWNGHHWYGPRTDESLGIASRSDRLRTFQITRGRNAWHGVTSYWWMQVSGMSLMMTGDDRAYREIDLTLLPAHLRPASIDDLDMQSWYHETGWPMPAMTCGVHWETQINNADIIYSVTGGIQLPRDARFNPRALPLRTVWPGFLINTLVFACAWWGVVWVIGSIRIRLRARANRCVQCGYPRRGLPVTHRCPECGYAV